WERLRASRAGGVRNAAPRRDAGRRDPVRAPRFRGSVVGARDADSRGLGVACEAARDLRSGGVGAARSGRAHRGGRPPVEDAVTGKMIDGLLPSGYDVRFSEIEAAFARLAHDRRKRRAPARALIATVIVVGPPERLIPAAEAIEHLGDVGVRAILISEGAQAEPVARVTDTAVAVSGLAPHYLNNAVAALRLSSLPAAVWWRGGSTSAFADLADLADRLIMDIDRPDDIWTAAVRLFDRTAFTDLRWAALTRWRAALAHLFDLPTVRRSAAQLKAVAIDAAEAPSARLFAGWLRSSLPWPPGATISIRV